jgi:hypothetical protein
LYGGRRHLRLTTGKKDHKDNGISILQKGVMFINGNKHIRS